MMWGRNKRREEPLKVTGERLTSMLGLDVIEPENEIALPVNASLPQTEFSPKCEHEPALEFASQAVLKLPSPEQQSQQNFSPDTLDHSALQTQPELSGIEAMSQAIRTVGEVLTQKAEEALKGPMKAAAPEAADNMFFGAERGLPAVVTYVQPHHPTPTEEWHVVAENELADLSAKSERLLEERARLFEEKLVAIVNKTLSQSEANVHKTVSRLESSFAQAKEIQSSLGDSLACLTKQAMEAVQTQTKTVEKDLSTIAGLIESQVTAGLAPVTNRIQECRAQAEEVHSTLQTSLAQVTRETAGAVLSQTQLFEQKVSEISAQAASQAESRLEARMGELREIAIRSLDDEIRSLSDRLQRSHIENLQKGLDETFESSRAKVQLVQQEFTNFSTDLLNQMRTESENIARNFHKRLQSDAQSVATNMVATMRGKLQKLADEFSKMFDGAFAN
ncbi:MAG: hypothetical protein JO061_02770 [Acidobacteriaceae bacterium]|nr:hypothetical protein [Acidobacteriaceae bacterium]